jgi:predicted ATP-grasp superfamily ATP-dependent carboligase
MDRVLVTSAQERFALAACRTLHDAGYAVSAVADQTPAATHWSRCCDSRHVLVDAKEDADAFVDGLVEIVRRQKHAVLLPGADAALLAISERRDRLEPYVRLGMPSPEAVAAATDKIRLVDAADASGLRSPETAVCHSRADGVRAAREIGMPVVLKPRCTAFERDGAIHQRPSIYIESEERLEACVDEFGLPYLIQRVIPGEVYSVAGVMTEEGMRAFAAARYVRTWPPEAGNVAFAETVEPPDGMSDRVAVLLRELGWTGIFELELIRAADGDFFSIDLNPRLYGSLALASRAGTPLAVIFCDWLLGRSAQPVTARAGVRYRWEDADLRHAVARFRTRRYRDAAAALRPRRDVAHAYFRITDPGPMVARALLLGGHRLGFGRRGG